MRCVSASKHHQLQVYHQIPIHTLYRSIMASPSTALLTLTTRRKRCRWTPCPVGAHEQLRATTPGRACGSRSEDCASASSIQCLAPTGSKRPPPIRSCCFSWPYRPMVSRRKDRTDRNAAAISSPLRCIIAAGKSPTTNCSVPAWGLWIPR